MRRHGGRPRNTAENFWRGVRRGGPDECWPWTRVCADNGYGQTMFNKRHKLTHRVAWELTHGPIPPGLFVCHQCDNRPCCNPGHLFLGTNSDNQLDSVAKGRYPRKVGESASTAKLTDAAAREIKRLAETTTGRALAGRFGVSPATISAVLSGKRWAHA